MSRVAEPKGRSEWNGVGSANAVHPLRTQSPARRTGHDTANTVIAPFAPPSTLCRHHLGNDLPIGLARAPILPTVGGFSPLSLSANIRLHIEASCTTTLLTTETTQGTFPLQQEQAHR